MTGLDYRSATPWEAGKEIRDAAERLKGEYGRITLIANSIGAYFSMNAGIDGLLDKAYFISPVVDMERLILELMNRAGGTVVGVSALCEGAFCDMDSSDGDPVRGGRYPDAV